ncbi:MAG TPA: HDOD domain-containing protein [Aromatoleum sp.]|uniref:HDOD domain-containing protein n=1 Tax=Aromatoleum sp. TaxID=2307007 RepID=UPI002B46E7FC|nr:HDOD domain-containing protein [Aromatoleum sp.]HJV28256.1 HDOD domain-containing protein [Aromatoleum sp.]
MHSAAELVTTVASLAPLPTVYTEVRDEMDKPTGSCTEIAHAISADPALTASLLRLVNSAFYGYGGKIETITRAVTILGMQQVHDLVLALSVSAAFSALKPQHFDMPAFWRSSVMRGLAAREIGRSHGILGAERLFVIALLADIGHLVMHQSVPELARDAADASKRNSEPLNEAERRVVGCDYVEVGATLMSHWKLPACFAKIIGAQLLPRLAAESAYEAAIVHLATRIAEADQNNESSTAAAERVSPVIWTTLDMQPPSFRDIRECAELDLANYVTLLIPDAGRTRHGH